MIDSLYVRKLILDSLRSDLGYYFFPNSINPVPAIAVIPDKKHGYHYPPEDTTVSGIEAVILRPQPQASPLLGFASKRIAKWEIYLKQWDNNGDLLKCAELLLNSMQDRGLTHTQAVYVHPDLDLGIIPSCRIAIVQRWIREQESP